ncbi:MAG: DsrE/DsrF/DrsH-like family protein [Planctomycetes bacterium]|nr:DsrE/DsrF/DrsH-like family protein [Planctomycetota bacterium]MCB9918446.1 DsrE/DsrF/DrsH-like family protein [Planctomycetota bacterium]
MSGTTTSEVPSSLASSMRACETQAESVPCATQHEGTKQSTFIVFSKEFDKQLMAFTLANSAAASGMSVTMFFTFWGITALRRANPSRDEHGKTFIDRMFGWMLPRSSKGLPLSNLQFAGLGPKLVRWRMRRLGVSSLEDQIEMAQALGVHMVLCDTSVELMGLRRSDFRDGLEIGGAAACIAAAANSEVAMVI